MPGQCFIQDDSNNGGGGGGSGVASAPGDKAMGLSYQLAGELVRDRLAQSPTEQSQLSRLRKSDLLVISGCYDHMDRPLQVLQTPFTEVVAQDLTVPLLASAKFVFANCGQSFPEQSAHLIAGFVEAGGVLLSTDYMLKYLLEVAFRDEAGNPYVRHNGMRTGDEIVDLTYLKKDDPTIQGFFDDGVEPRWWLEKSSFPIKVLDESKVEVLARAAELGRKYGDDAVIVRFQHGKGVVVHMLSHVYLQKGEAKPGQVDQDASSYATSVGASRRTLITASQMGPNTRVTSATVRSAATSIGFVSRILTNPRGTPTRDVSDGTVANMMGATQKRPPEEIGGVEPHELKWAPPVYAYEWKPERGDWAMQKTPFYFDFKQGLYALPTPASKTWIVIGRGDGEIDKVVRDKLGKIRERLRTEDPEAELVYVVIKDKRDSSPVSRVHSLIKPLGEAQYTIEALDGDTTVLSGDDPDTDTYLQGKQDPPEKHFLSRGNIVKLSPGIVFRLRSRDI